MSNQIILGSNGMEDMIVRLLPLCNYFFLEAKPTIILSLEAKIYYKPISNICRKYYPKVSFNATLLLLAWLRYWGKQQDYSTVPVV